MKTHVTRRELEKRYEHIINTAYCATWYLFLEIEADFFNATTSWNFDAWSAGDAVIVSGYRNLPRGITASASTCARYNKLAYAIRKSKRSYQAQQNALDKLRARFIDEAIEDARK